MRQAAQLLAEERGPVKDETRVGLIRLLNAVADQGGSGTAGVYVWDATANIAESLLTEPMDSAIGSTRQGHQDGWYR